MIELVEHGCGRVSLKSRRPRTAPRHRSRVWIEAVVVKRMLRMVDFAETDSIVTGLLECLGPRCPRNALCASRVDTCGPERRLEVPRLRAIRSPSAHEGVAARRADGLLHVRVVENHCCLCEGVEVWSVDSAV